MSCANCPYNLFDEELGHECCQFGSPQERGFNAPCATVESSDSTVEE